MKSIVNNTRAYIAGRLRDCLDGGESLSALACHLEKSSFSIPEKRLIQWLCYGVVRQFSQLQYYVNTLLFHPIRPKDKILFYLLCAGIYELLEGHTPVYAIVSQTVEATHALNRSWATRLVNATLRQFQRKQTPLTQACHHASDLSIRWAHPTWLIAQLQQAWPQHWEAILTANNQMPPFTLRVNIQKTTLPDYVAQLALENLETSLIPGLPMAVTLKTPVPIERLPHFAQGHCSVQDAAAQWAALLLEVRPHDRVLDACAAPGGKTGHLLEMYPGLLLTSLDIDAERIQKVHDTVLRLMHSQPSTLQIAIQDAHHPHPAWDGILFDRILLDAPCSGTGVIRRHPDIKWHRTPTDITHITARQYTLLSALWSQLKPGGILLYVTCSILPSENQDLILRFLQTHPDAQEKPISLPLGHAQSVGHQLLPGEFQMDGFYYAKLQKAPT
jgi:16S rRNA (cytosine967-C5)-methyltransferase